MEVFQGLVESVQHGCTHVKVIGKDPSQQALAHILDRNINDD